MMSIGLAISVSSVAPVTDSVTSYVPSPLSTSVSVGVMVCFGALATKSSIASAMATVGMAVPSTNMTVAAAASKRRFHMRLA